MLLFFSDKYPGLKWLYHTGVLSLVSGGISLLFSIMAAPICIPTDSAPGSLFSTPAAAAAAKSLQSCLTLCDPIDGSPPGPTTPGILQARTLEWAAISFSNAWKWKVKGKSLSRVGLLAISLPGSSVYGIFQARVLEWGAIAFSIPICCLLKPFWQVWGDISL